jgi:hypothetical protein
MISDYSQMQKVFIEPDACMSERIAIYTIGGDRMNAFEFGMCKKCTLFFFVEPHYIFMRRSGAAGARDRGLSGDRALREINKV